MSGKAQSQVQAQEPQELTPEEEKIIDRLFEEWAKITSHCTPGDTRYFVVKTEDAGGNPIYILIDYDGEIAVVCYQLPDSGLSCSATNDENIVAALAYLYLNGADVKEIDSGLAYSPCP